MAVIFDVNLLSKKIIDIKLLEKILYYYGITINSARSIDDWTWNNERQIRMQESIKEEIDKGKIIILKLESRRFVETELYIERMDKEFLYNLWFNTEGYPQLDNDAINEENRIYYEKAYQGILRIANEERDYVKIAGIGIETDFYYCENEEDILQNSKNITAWILNDGINMERGLSQYKQKKINGTNKIVFEKV